MDCTLRYAYGACYNAVTKTRLSTPYRLANRLKLVALGLDAASFDIVFCQRPAIPQLSGPERLLARLNPRIVFDYDDAIWLGPGGAESARRKRAFSGIVEASSHIIAGNSFLASQALSSEKTSVIPTVIDTDRYVPVAASKDESCVIGWMGTRGNFPSLLKLVPSITRVLEKYPNVKLRLVSNSVFSPLSGHAQVDQLAWSAKEEREHLQSFDVGLMPLISSEQTRGKCAFKMIMYMAVGLPVVVSAVGANVEVLEDSGAGFLEPSFDWDRSLSRLIDDAGLRKTMGQAGREHVVSNYSITAVLPRYLEIFDRVVKAGSRPRSL